MSPDPVTDLFLSGFCNPTNPADSHARCRGAHADAMCRCHCHEGTPLVPAADGFHPGVPEPAYHADPGSLSHSGAKLILRAPALYRWRRDHPERKAEFDYGSAAHALVLGIGDPIRVIDADSWRTKDARAERDAAYEAGEIPLLAADHQRVQDMADALSGHQRAMELLSLDGAAEVSAYHHDERTGVRLRCRFDYLADAGIAVDYKTSAAAVDRETFRRTATNFGYYSQAAWYGDMAEALGRPLLAFAFLCQEKESPYLPAVHVLSEDFIALGRASNRRAIDTYAACTESGIWPGHTDTDEPLDPPRWLTHREDAS